jgi:ribose transport system permease protein
VSDQTTRGAEPDTPTAPPATALEAPAGMEGREGFHLLPWLADRGIVLFTIVLIIVAAVFVDGFASLANITDVFNRAAPIGIVAVAMTFVVISANSTCRWWPWSRPRP